MAKRGALWVMTALAVAALCLGAPLAAQGPQRVGLVLVFDAQRVETRCVSFSEVQITGTEVLERSGLEVVLNRTVGLGAALCSVDGVGCRFPAEDCFCQCRGADCRYWNYWRWVDGQWVYSSFGASSNRLADGALEAWVWGNGKVPPPALTFADVCEPPAPPTATPTVPFLTTTDTSKAEAAGRRTTAPPQTPSGSTAVGEGETPAAGGTTTPAAVGTASPEATDGQTAASAETPAGPAPGGGSATPNAGVAPTPRAVGMASPEKGGPKTPTPGATTEAPPAVVALTATSTPADAATAAAAPHRAGERPSRGGYVAFGGMALALVAVWALGWRRSRGRRQR
ncbi:MAG: hypothetical protein GX605_07135 [Chloroflexi bacterium]|nr:hypothetical protein [Chloroflexota bacterium]